MDQSTIAQLQLLQQNLQNLLLQKQQLQNNLIELESALQEIKTSEKCYKIMGHIMVASPKDAVSKELAEKKEMNDLRLKNYLSQEEKLKRSIGDIQKELMQEKK
ncbi:MAG: prefoldin subunit [Nanoarchaeota archaeon]|nr:prefoldin subunit [Nanoarchaeota archaeon]